MPVHSSLTGSDLHEPKGISSASADTVYVADGAGSGTWEKITNDSLAGDTVRLRHLNAVLPDVSASSSVLIPLPDACTVLSIIYILGGPITVANASVSVARGNGSSLGAATSILYSSSAEGDRYTFTPSANNSFTGTGSYLKISSNGGSTTASPLYIVVRYELSE